jgi:hypothetical protein
MRLPNFDWRLRMIEEYRGLQIKPVSKSSLMLYLDLFEAAFPTFKTSLEYLRWLYFQNPNGVAVGFDAFDADKVVAHYVCIPIEIDVYAKPALLALNTATHPKYQGRGLLKVLANKTYDVYGADFSCVVGVANAQAIKPLTKHLGFVHIGDLELRLGILDSSTIGRRSYTEEEYLWRANCPNRSLKTTVYRGRFVKFTRRLYGIFPVSAICPLRKGSHSLSSTRSNVGRLGLTLDWRRHRKPILFLPKKLKPSPLSFVFRALNESDSTKLKVWTFPDFDAL